MFQNIFQNIFQNNNSVMTYEITIKASIFPNIDQKYRLDMNIYL